MAVNYHPHAVIISSGKSYFLRVSTPGGIDIKVLDEERRQQNKTACDVALSVEDEIIFAHRIVLARNSSYFKQHFNAEARRLQAIQDMTGENNKRIVMKHKSSDLEESFSPMSPPAPKLRKTISSCLPQRSSAIIPDPLSIKMTPSSNRFTNSKEKTDFSKTFCTWKNNEVLSLPGIKLKGFLEILNFMYTSELCVMEENVHDIAIASNLLQIPIVFEACRLVLSREPGWKMTKYNITIKRKSAVIKREFNYNRLHKLNSIDQQLTKLNERHEEEKSDKKSFHNGKAENEELTNTLRKLTSSEKNAIILNEGLKDQKPAEVNRRSSERKFSRSPKHKILDGNTNILLPLQAPSSIEAKYQSGAFIPDNALNLQKGNSIKEGLESNGDCDGILDLRQKPKMASSNKKVYEAEFQRLEPEVPFRSNALRRTEKEEKATPKIKQWPQPNYAETMSTIQHLQSPGSLEAFPALTKSLTTPSPVPAVLIQTCSKIYPNSYRSEIPCNAITLDQHGYAALASNRLLQANSLSNYHATAKLVNALNLPVSKTMSAFHKQVHTAGVPYSALPFIPKYQSTPVISTHYSPYICDQRSTFPVQPPFHDINKHTFKTITKNKLNVYRQDTSPTYHKESLSIHKDTLSSNYMHAKESNTIQDSGTDTDSLRAASVDSGLDTDHNKNVQSCPNAMDEASSRTSVSETIDIIAATRVDHVSSLTRCDDMRLKDTARPWVM